MKRKKLWVLALVIGGYCILNFGWMHAALAGIVAPNNCPTSLIQTARLNVNDLYGETKSDPMVICLDGPTLGLDVSHGMTRFAPLLPSIVILGPEGTNENVASHEYAHAEFAKRTSALLRTYRVPTWFDEGLAMQLDHRAHYSEIALQVYLDDENLTRPSLSALSSPGEFFQAGTQGRMNYALARCVVSHWLEDAGADGLNTLVSQIGWITPFPAEVFAVYEAKCSRQSRNLSQR